MKPLKALSLKRETLLHLNDQALLGALGGEGDYVSSACPTRWTCNSNCVSACLSQCCGSGSNQMSRCVCPM